MDFYWYSSRSSVPVNGAVREPLLNEHSGGEPQQSWRDEAYAAAVEADPSCAEREAADHLTQQMEIHMREFCKFDVESLISGHTVSFLLSYLSFLNTVDSDLSCANKLGLTLTQNCQNLTRILNLRSGPHGSTNVQLTSGLENLPHRHNRAANQKQS
jgi:hypothetical protein